MSTATETRDDGVTQPDEMRELRRSVGLSLFRKSPFRLLRLPVTASAKQAVWQCDKALARARVGMALPDPDPVPWLPAGDEIEIQEATQTMESPLARLVEQLLWFDFVDDPQGASLLAALIGEDAAALRAYLAARDGSLANRLNQLNVRLLLGFSLLRGVGPRIATTGRAQQAANLAWQRAGGVEVVDDPHRAILASGALLGGNEWASLLAEAVSGWGELLASDELAAHVRAKITTLGDELIGHDDVETLVAAIRTKLADVVVGETRAEMARGSVANVGYLSALAGKSHIDAEVWLVAFKPLRTQFQAELADLQPEATTGNGEVEDVAAYLERLGSLADRWRPLDEAQLLGLATMIDDAVGEAFGRLRAVQREKQLEPRFRDVLARVSVVAASNSIKERVRAYMDRLTDVAKGMCHFCGKRELEGSSCASLSSQREISRTRYGNTISVQYQVGARPVARCPQCAQRHGFLKTIGSLAFFSLTTSILLFAALKPSTWFHTVSFGAGIALVLMAIAGAYGLGFVARAIGASVITPKGERKFDDYRTTTAHQGLRDDGFFTMKYDYRPDAWELVNKHGVKARHGGMGDSGEALKWVIQIGLVILVIALKVCSSSHRY
ncbi:MAG: hypothetical protein NT062_15695 [Proteobacteria bacterium]|nr:hypothetical protein [Pseudomonadota bacterium]